MNRKRMAALAAAVVLALGGYLALGQKETNNERFTMSFFGTFDTVISIIGYAPDQATFDREAGRAKALFETLNEQFDKYNSYPGVTNLHTVNQQAGKGPVQVPQELFDLMAYSIREQAALNDTVNIALGSVLKLWHDARDLAVSDPALAYVPDMAALEEAALHTDISDVLLDSADRTVFFSDPALTLDLGAAAKGYATELVAQMLLKGPMPSFIINAGGNVRTGNAPRDGRDNWGVAIQDPDGQGMAQTQTDIIEVLFVHDLSVVTSGDYQRYYLLDGVRYHHIVSPVTLMPTHFMRSVSIVTEDSAYADLLSTAVFLMPFEEGLAYVESLPGVEAVWVLNDRSVRMTKGAEAMTSLPGTDDDSE